MLYSKKCDYQVHFPLKKVDKVQSNFVYFNNFKLTSEDELVEIVTDTGIKCGFSDPCTKFELKEYLSVFLPIWTHIINLSLSTGSTDNLKHATITPLLKNADLDFNKYENFRPVSNLTFINKLTERVVLKSISNHMHHKI